MAKKSRNRAVANKPQVNSNSAADSAAPATAAPAPLPPAGVAKAKSTSSVLPLPSEITKGDWTIPLLALMMFFAPTLGVPHEFMLQDTLKSIVVSFVVLVAALLFFWGLRNKSTGLRWHWVMLLPLSLMAYALGSMAWSHTYLGGVEAIRWFVFSVMLWLTLNTANRERLPLLILGIHLGGMGTAFWGVLQFWFNVTYIPQGPNPASTFVNRNFAAEFIACTLPFSFLLLARARSMPAIAWLAFGLGLNLVYLMMTGTRSAMLSFFVAAGFIVVVLWLARKQLAFSLWSSTQRIVAAGVLMATVFGLGSIQTSNPKLLEENRTDARGTTALTRAFARTKSMTEREEYTERSFSVRLIMWKATARVIQARPLTGVGAGAWEADIPLYQGSSAQLETDYYVHNEILQLLAEYGLVGWLFLILLLSYLSWSAWRTWRIRNGPHAEEAIWRAFALISMLSFLVVSNVGFPWRMAATGALFALFLGILAASDARLGWRNAFGAARLPSSAGVHQVGAVIAIACLVLAAYITQKAAESESKIVSATKMAMSISASGRPTDPRWDGQKRQLLALIKDGTDINPHYRKITPMVADELAKWGDWKNAVWVWESVVGSRPYVVAIMSNIARGYLSMGDLDKAQYWYERSVGLRPDAPSIKSLGALINNRQGKHQEVVDAVRKTLVTKDYDLDMLTVGFNSAFALKDWPLTVQLLKTRGDEWPNVRMESYLMMANVYATQLKSNEKAVETYKALWAATPEAERAALRARLPNGALIAMGMSTAPNTSTATTQSVTGTASAPAR